jgi:hypothetical protein
VTTEEVASGPAFSAIISVWVGQGRKERPRKGSGRRSDHGHLYKDRRIQFGSVKEQVSTGNTFTFASPRKDGSKNKRRVN